MADDRPDLHAAPRRWNRARAERNQLTGCHGTSLPVADPLSARFHSAVGTPPPRRGPAVGTVPPRRGPAVSAIPPHRGPAVGTVPSRRGPAVGAVPLRRGPAVGTVPSRRRSAVATVPPRGRSGVATISPRRGLAVRGDAVSARLSEWVPSGVERVIRPAT